MVYKDKAFILRTRIWIAETENMYLLYNYKAKKKSV